MTTRPSSTAQPADAAPKSKVTGTDVLWILLSAFLVTLLANGAMIYCATDVESDFRSLIEVLC
jgi:hypothetical protein